MRLDVGHEADRRARCRSTPGQEGHVVNSIRYWNDVALEASKVSHTNGAKEQTGPTLSVRALTIGHLPMYDAFAGRFESSRPDPTSAIDSSIK